MKKVFIFLYRIFFFYTRFKKYSKFENFINNKMDLTNKIYKSYDSLCESNEIFQFDTLICGSDQIWNTDITNGLDDVYFLGFGNENQKKISYAASLGRKEIDVKFIKNYKENLDTFHRISVREVSSVDCFLNLGLDKISVVLDPTLLLSNEVWTEIANQSRLRIDSDYILVYRLEDTNEFNEIVKYVQKKLNLRILSFNKMRCYKNEKNIASAGPEDFLKLFKNASFIITNSFHGTVFSILFNKKNIIVPNTKKPARMVDLANNVLQSKRIIRNMKEITDDILYSKPSYKNTMEELNKLREMSYEFLEEAILDEKKG